MEANRILKFKSLVQGISPNHPAVADVPEV